MSDAVEQAAERALRAHELHHGRAVREWSTLPSYIREPWRKVARAVLEEPTRTELLADRFAELDDNDEGEALDTEIDT